MHDELAQPGTDEIEDDQLMAEVVGICKTEDCDDVEAAAYDNPVGPLIERWGDTLAVHVERDGQSYAIPFVDLGERWEHARYDGTELVVHWVKLDRGEPSWGNATSASKSQSVSGALVGAARSVLNRFVPVETAPEPIVPGS